MTATMIRTRQSFGSQIKSALEGLRSDGTIHSFEVVQTTDQRQAYKIHGAQPNGSPFAGVVEVELLPGQVADRLNAAGHDIRFGRA